MLTKTKIWQRACAALAKEEYGVAIAMLSAELKLSENNLQISSEIHLYLASIYSLYGEEGVSNMEKSLRAAESGLPGECSGLYTALSAELLARSGTAFATDMPEEVDSPIGRFHFFRALLIADEPAKAMSIEIEAKDLPIHMISSFFSWQAEASEKIGNTADAINFYTKAAEYAYGIKKASILQEKAALYLELGKIEEASDSLSLAQELYPAAGSKIDQDTSLSMATWHFLKSQVFMHRGLFEEALKEIITSEKLEIAGGDPSHGVAILYGQICSQLDRLGEALHILEKALLLTPAEDRSFVNHEISSVLMQMDRPVDACERLEAIMLDAEYPHRPEALADLSECEYRLGKISEARLHASAALEQGALVSASMVLGGIAMEYYRLDEALEHYQRSIEHAQEGGQEWVIAHQLAADVLAQQIDKNPAALIMHARQALTGTSKNDDWYSILTDYISKAEQFIDSPSRTLN